MPGLHRPVPSDYKKGFSFPSGPFPFLPSPSPLPAIALRSFRSSCFTCLSARCLRFLAFASFRFPPGAGFFPFLQMPCSPKNAAGRGGGGGGDGRGDGGDGGGRGGRGRGRGAPDRGAAEDRGFLTI